MSIKFFSDIDIIELVKRDSKVNFIASAITPWHAHGIDSVIKNLANNKIPLKGIILLRSLGDNGYSISKKNFLMLDHGDFEVIYYKPQNQKKIDYLSYLIDEKIKYKLGVREIYLLSSRYPDLRTAAILTGFMKELQIQHIVVDEGIGSYTILGLEYIGWYFQSLKNKPLKQRMVNTIKEFISHCILDTGIMKKKLNKYETIFVRKGNKLIKNEKIIDCYRYVFRKWASKIKEGNYLNYENSIIINTQPFFDEGQIKEDYDIKLIKIVCDICKKNGIRVILKPHPREKNLDRYSSLNCEIDKENNVSQEIILSSLKRKPLAIVAFNSTTLITSKVFWEINTISLCELIDRKYIENNSLKNIDKFKKVFEDYINLPRTLLELEELLIS